MGDHADDLMFREMGLTGKDPWEQTPQPTTNDEDVKNKLNDWPSLKQAIIRLLDSRTNVVGSGLGEKPLALVERFWLDKLSRIIGDTDE